MYMYESECVCVCVHVCVISSRVPAASLSMLVCGVAHCVLLDYSHVSLCAVHVLVSGQTLCIASIIVLANVVCLQ